MLKTSAAIWHCGAALLLGLVGGCAPMTFPKQIPLPGQDDKPRMPMKITALWTDTVLVEAGVAGFGGRIMFYGSNDEEPIKVEGELTVFAYDDSGSVRQASTPARKYVFRAAELDKHYSKSTLGHSYSFWLPWDKVGGPQKQISLIARFKSQQGGVVMSEMTKHLLPGVPPEASEEDQQPPITTTTTTPVARAAHQAPLVSPAAAGLRGMSTTTITLPEALSQAVKRAPAATPLPEIETIAAAPPQSGLPSRQTARTPAVVPAAPAANPAAESAGIQAIVRDAVREAMAENDSQSVDRFGRRRHRARVQPKLPPVRDPAATPLHPAGLPSGLPSSLPPVGPIQAARAQGVLPATTQPPTSWAR